MCNMQEFGIPTKWTMTGQSRTTTSRRKELCTLVLRMRGDQPER